VYEDHGIFSKAIRVSITIRELYRSGEKSFDNLESVLMMSYPRYYKEEMEKIIIGEEIESSVIYSIMRRESAFDKDAISSAGAVGLLQLLPENGYKSAQKINKKIVWSDLKNPEINILLGYEYFKSLLQRYNGNYVIAFASYNAGVNNVDNWIGKYGLEDIEEFIENIEFSETRDYVKAVLEGWWIYKKLYES
jgi:soluble lytic murein transglycosylase